jgi:hypothetical protein
MILIRVVPSVIIAWLAYHAVALAYGADFEANPLAILQKTVISVPLVHGAVWHISIGDLITMFTVVTGFGEVLKASDFARVGFFDYLLVSLLFAASLVEFLVVPIAQTSVFFFIVLALFLDLTVGYVVSVRTARRDLAVQQAPL